MKNLSKKKFKKQEGEKKEKSPRNKNEGKRKENAK